MENEKIEKKSSGKTILLIILGIVVAVAMVIVGWLLGTKFANTEDKTLNSNQNSSTNQSNTNANVNEKEMVTDADYVISYKNDNGFNEIPTKGEPIKVPVINFNTSDAEKVNAEIKANYLEYEKSIKEALSCQASNDDDSMICGSFSIGYKTYETDTTISVVVLFQMSAGSIPIPNYLVYNFDKNTGKLLTINDLLTKTGMTKEALIEKTMKDINAIANSESYRETGMIQEMDNMRTFVTKNIDLNKTKITDGDGIAYFFDETGTLTAVTTLICPYLENGTLVKIVPNSAA